MPVAPPPPAIVQPSPKKLVTAAVIYTIAKGRARCQAWTYEHDGDDYQRSYLTWRGTETYRLSFAWYGLMVSHEVEGLDNSASFTTCSTTDQTVSDLGYAIEIDGAKFFTTAAACAQALKRKEHVEYSPSCSQP